MTLPKWLADALREELKKTKFKFAETYKDFAPHWYILEKWNPRLFELMKLAIKKYGYNGTFYGKKYRYFNFDGYKYWIIEDVLNREPLKEENKEKVGLWKFI